jgi:hypothetical protein
MSAADGSNESADVDQDGPAPGSAEWRRQIEATLPEGEGERLGAGELEILRPELSLGSTAEAKAANDALRALARASRAYLIYDARNEIIRTFLGSLKEAFEAFSRAHGDMFLEVRPFEFVLRGDVVYLERDRERSLAFKLFRDGVRRVTIRAGVTWDELTALLQILSIRYIGVRLNEDDVLTLLWKAGFANIEVEAVEGFIEDDETEIPDGAASGAALEELNFSPEDVEHQQVALRAPPGFDLPAPELPPAVQPRRMFLPDGHREELREELGSQHLAEHVLRLNDYVLRALADPIEYLNWADAKHFLKESRDFLMSEGEIESLLAYQRLVEHFSGAPELDDDTRDAARELLGGFSDRNALRRILRSIPMSMETAPREYRELLEMAEGDPLETLIEVLTEERSAHLRRVIRQLIEGYMPDRTEDVLAAYHANKEAVAADLLRVLAEQAPDVANGLFQQLVRGTDSEVKVEFLRMAQQDRLQGNLRSLLILLLSAPEDRIRIRALKVIAGQGEKGAFRPVVARAEDALKARADELEIEAYGRSLAHIDTKRALEQFEAWSQPVGRLKRLVAGPEAGRQRIALHGLKTIETEEGTMVLRLLAKNAVDASLRQEARDEIVRRARAARGESEAASSSTDSLAVEPPTGSFDAVTGILPAITDDMLPSDTRDITRDGHGRSDDSLSGDRTGMWLPVDEDLE